MAAVQCALSIAQNHKTTKPQKHGGNKQLPNINGKPLQYLEKEKGLCIISSKIERKNKYWFEQTWAGVYFLKY